VEGLTFDSDFDSGNLKSVEYSSISNEYRLCLSRDNEGTENDNNYATWFYFSIEGGGGGQSVQLSKTTAWFILPRT
jgi:hypothetical protein